MSTFTNPVISRRSALRLGGAAVTAGAAMSAGLVPAARATGSPTYSLPDVPATGITRGQIFDFNTPDPSVFATTQTRFVWGSNHPTIPGGPVTSGYWPVFRSSTAYPPSWWLTNHPDWILYQADRVTPAWELGNTNNIPVNFTNPELREFFFDTFIMSRINAGYPIIGLDNFGVYNLFSKAGSYDANGNWVDLFNPTDWYDQAHADAALDWLSYLTDRCHALGIGVAANISIDPTHDLTNTAKALDIVDIVVDETGFTRAGNIEEYNGQMWLNKFNLVRGIKPTTYYVSLNKSATAQLADASEQQVNYAVANYFLYRNQRTMLAICGKQEYGYFIDHPKLYADIGTELDDPTQDAGGAWHRTYSDGYVIVNSTLESIDDVRLPPGCWIDADGNRWSRLLTVPAITGMVLRRFAGGPR